MKTTRHTARAGLTLLELMIVLIILVMLFAIAGPRLLGTQRKADIKGTIAQIGNLDAALKLYYADMRTFPNTEEGLNALIKRPADEQKGRRWDGPYLDDDRLPSDAWGNPFVYEYPPSQGTRDFPNISSPGPDGDASTDEDNIKNWHGGSKEEGSTEGDATSDQSTDTSTPSEPSAAPTTNP